MRKSGFWQTKILILEDEYPESINLERHKCGEREGEIKCIPGRLSTGCDGGGVVEVEGVKRQGCTMETSGDGKKRSEKLGVWTLDGKGQEQ